MAWHVKKCILFFTIHQLLLTTYNPINGNLQKITSVINIHLPGFMKQEWMNLVFFKNIFTTLYGD